MNTRERLNITRIFEKIVSNSLGVPGTQFIYTSEI